MIHKRIFEIDTQDFTKIKNFCSGKDGAKIMEGRGTGWEILPKRRSW